MNQVQKIALNFDGENEFFFQSLYADWDQYWTTKIEKATEKILDKYNDSSFLVELDELHLELGSISESDFSLSFIMRYEEELENVLLKHLYGSNAIATKKIKIKTSKAELLFYFLLHGSMPWNTDTVSKNINSLFLEVATHDSKALKSFLRTYGHYTSLQQRLVLQFNDNVLIRGIQVIAPNESDYIVSYVQFIQAKHTHLNSKEISESHFNETVWQVVYSYLLNNKSSFFDKKSFMEQTIRQLSNRYLISYTDLLQLLLLNFKKEINYPIELFNLLTILKENEFKLGSNSQDWRKWLGLLTTSERNPSSQPYEDKQLIIKMLQNDQNYRFLQVLNEVKILNLLKSIVPQHAPFVKTYAKQLEQQKNQGMLQGKAGGEFRILKWRIMFPILLEKNSTGFNRHYFVERVLQKIAAYYNLKTIEVLDYLHVAASTLKIDSELTRIFQIIFLRYKSKQEPSTHYHEVTISEIHLGLKDQLELSIEQKDTWQAFLTKEKNRNTLLNKLSDTENKVLIQTLYQYDSKFILAYSDLIKNHQNKAVLEGKTSGNLAKLKWQFIHEVILESKSQGFNKRHFVERVIKKMASHYNLKAEQLITFFYLEAKRKDFMIPYELLQVMELIHSEYDQKWTKTNKENQGQIKKTKSIDQEKSDLQFVEALLSKYFGKEVLVVSIAKLIAQNTAFLRFIEPILSLEYEFRNYLSSKFNITINKKQLLQLLSRISKESNSLSKVDVLQKIIAYSVSQLKNETHQLSFMEHLHKLSKKNNLLKISLEIQQDTIKELEEIDEQEETLPEVDNHGVVFIENAGLIMLTPFLPRLFTMLQLTENGKFKNRNAQIKAIFLMQYAVFERTDFPEFELELNKLLVGFKTGIPLPLSIELNEEEKTITEAMLQGAVQHWEKVKTIDGLRKGFLQREGKLAAKNEEIELMVENKAFDVLLDNIPWSFRTTKFSWMEKAIQVKWR